MGLRTGVQKGSVTKRQRHQEFKKLINSGDSGNKPLSFCFPKPLDEEQINILKHLQNSLLHEHSIVNSKYRGPMIWFWFGFWITIQAALAIQSGPLKFPLRLNEFFENLKYYTSGLTTESGIYTLCKQRRKLEHGGISK